MNGQRFHVGHGFEVDAAKVKRGRLRDEVRRGEGANQMIIQSAAVNFDGNQCVQRGRLFVSVLDEGAQTQSWVEFVLCRQIDSDVE